MLTRFDILVIVMIVLAITGWPSGFARGRLPEPLLTIIVVVILIVLLLLGVVRF